MAGPTIEQLYAVIRGGRPAMDLPHWEDLDAGFRQALEGAYGLGILAAAQYVGGNWSDAKTMAEHLRQVGNGDKPMYAD